MEFVAEIREAVYAGEEAVKTLLDSNELSKALKEIVTITDTEIGGMASKDFAHSIRAGEIEEAFEIASPSMSQPLKENKTLVELMKRQADVMPESSLATVEKETGVIEKRLPDLDSATDAEAIKSEIAKDTEIKSKVEKIENEAKPSSNNTKTYLFLGAAVITGLGIYEALDAYAKAKTGCFLYTKNTAGQIAACKVLNASCLNPSASTTVTTCTPEIMGATLAAVKCDDWNESKDGACYKCSYSSFPENSLTKYQTLQCIEKPSVWNALGELIYTSGQSIVNGIGELLKKLILWGGVGLLIVGIVWVIIKVFGMATRKSTTRPETDEPTAPRVEIVQLPAPAAAQSAPTAAATTTTTQAMPVQSVPTAPVYAAAPSASQPSNPAYNSNIPTPVYTAAPSVAQPLYNPGYNSNMLTNDLDTLATNQISLQNKLNQIKYMSPVTLRYA